MSISVRRILLLLALVAAFGLPIGVLAEGTGGAISGTLTQGTPGGGSVGGLAVTLGRYNGMDLQQQYTTTADDKGHYSFTGLPTGNDQEAYVVRASYQKVDYNSSMIQLTKSPTATADIKVYETTTDGSKVSLASRGVVIAGADASSRLLSIFEILAIDNTGDRTYLGNNGEVLRIPLPDGTAQIEPQPGFDFGDARMDKGQLVTTGAIPPGSSNAMIAYSVPYKGTSATINVPTAMPTGTLRVMVKDGTYNLASPALNDNGSVNVGGDNYHVLSVDKPIVGDAIAVTITNLPKAGASSDSNRGPIYAAVAALAGVFAAGALVFQILRRRAATAAPRLALVGAGGVTLETVPPRADERIALAANLNALEAEHKAGKVDADTFNARRAEIVEAIKAETRRMKGLDELDD